MSLDVIWLVWRLRVVLESEGITEEFSLNFLFVLPRLPAAATATLLLTFYFFLSDPRRSTTRGKGNVLLGKVSSVVVAGMQNGLLPSSKLEYACVTWL